MRQIIGAFGILFIMMANIFICTGLIGASGQVAAAKEYKSQVVAELENSNFNPGVIDACKKKAAEDGYELEISDCVYDAWQVSLPHTGTWNLRREYYICDCEVIDLSLMMIVEKFGGAFLGILAGSAVIRMFYEILNYVSSF